MEQRLTNNFQDRLIAELSHLWNDQQDQLVIAEIIQALNSRYGLLRKMAKEPGVEDIVKQMAGRLANSYPGLSDLQNKRILDIACGSNTSKLPASLYVNTPFGEMALGRASKGYTALFEPWFCRILLAMGATPV
jgi:hypothetical protein